MSKKEAQLLAIRAEIEGMAAANQFQQTQGMPPLYIQSAFDFVIRKIQQLSDQNLEDTDSLNWRKMAKEAAICILRETITSGSGGYYSEFGPATHRNLINIITNGEKDYCARNGHIPHRIYKNVCVCCSGKIAAQDSGCVKDCTENISSDADPGL